VTITGKQRRACVGNGKDTEISTIMVHQGNGVDMTIFCTPDQAVKAIGLRGLNVVCEVDTGAANVLTSIRQAEHVKA